MEKQKRWQFYLIGAVILLTLYNILPTVFYYAQPLKRPINAQDTTKIEREIGARVNGLEEYSLSWLEAQAKNLKLKPIDISLDSANPRLFKATFKHEREAKLFAENLMRSGNLIPFVPAEVTPVNISPEEGNYVVTLQRKVGIHFDPANQDFFEYVPKKIDNVLSPEYKKLIEERAFKLALGFGGESIAAKTIVSFDRSEEDYLRLARSIVEFETTFGEKSPLTQRFFASFTQTTSPMSKESLLKKVEENFSQLSDKFKNHISLLEQERATLEKEGKFLSSDKLQSLAILENQKSTVDSALAIFKRNSALFKNSVSPLLPRDFATSFVKKDNNEVIEIGNRNPFVQALVINWDKETIELTIHPDIVPILAKKASSEVESAAQEKLKVALFNAIGSVARTSDEEISEGVSHFTISLNQLTNSTSLLLLDLKKVAQEEIKTISAYLEANWHPQGELKAASFPQFLQGTLNEKEKLGLILYSPLLDSPKEGFNSQSIYVILKGFEPIIRKYESLSESEEKKAFESDFSQLALLLKQNGFSGYAGISSYLPSQYAGDYIFELTDPSLYLIAATREDFSLKGGKEKAVLEFTDIEQRLLTLNKIETRMHEDLVKWKDEYQASSISVDPKLRYDVPPPAHNALWSNLALSAKKYFRGDERKILKWGLDLSGGKTIRIGLKDQNNQPITDEDDLREAINELYVRVNKLGVSEVALRQEGGGIVLDFPGSQGLSGSELVKASAMYFHVVNEKFSPNNPLLKEAVNTFLEEVWNEAVITNKKDAEGIHEIAWQHLGGSLDHEGEFYPPTSHAKLLYDNGLRLSSPKNRNRSSAFDDTVSEVARLRGETFTEWYGQTNPLLIIFRNFALEGSNLTDIQTGYDQSEGNVLSFSVKSSNVKDGQRINPRDDFYAWTSQFSEEKILGTPKEAFSQGRGWRMAVILNGTVVNAPTLNAALRDSARITGHFSQREINTLASDLKAGSLSFTPYILSEENVSPDLGKEQRMQGVLAAFIGIMLVIATMCIVYRFGGVVASVAVIFNLLIIWAVLQNLSVVLTLPSIAGIILSIGMAVDANVLVFERIREEFAKHGKLATAVAAGYRRAFSAIVDSNVTTVIAALILLNFDAGPIKGFALTLIIGIVSSMFSALFMTRYFFASWVQNPQHKTLSMAKLFQDTKFDFLKRSKAVIVGSILVMVVGVFLLISQKSTIFGMDFTGGYALNLEYVEKANTNYRLATEEALLKQGLNSSDFHIRELNKPHQIRLQLGVALEEKGKPFYKIDENKKIETPLFGYQNYPRIVWIVDALEKEGLQLNPASLPTLNLHWHEMSGQLSDTMRTQALIGLGLALLAILIYITFRFEFNYAISSIIALVHDIVITVGILAILHYFYYSIQIDLQVIAALLTIVGYSLNDTIIIFDRIREELKVYRKLTFKEIVNHALNATLNRTIMTSGTTLLVLLALVTIGGKTIFNFSLILTIGIGVGTLSSLFVAAPLLVYFHERPDRVKSTTPKVGSNEF